MMGVGDESGAAGAEAIFGAPRAVPAPVEHGSPTPPTPPTPTPSAGPAGSPIPPSSAGSGDDIDPRVVRSPAFRRVTSWISVGIGVVMQVVIVAGQGVLFSTGVVGGDAELPVTLVSLSIALLGWLPGVVLGVIACAPGVVERWTLIRGALGIGLAVATLVGSLYYLRLLVVVLSGI